MNDLFMATVIMIAKMSAITLAYVAVTFMLWKALKDREMHLGDKIALGVLYGIMSVFSTHFGINYGDMVLNLRDLAPMAAGFFFDPLSGIIAGLIGGIERYIVGTYFGIGSYTRIACSLSTCLAGFFAAFLSKTIFKGKKPSIGYAFFMGAVIEVFHMYVVFLTHRDDMSMAFYVVRQCSVPMILFSGIGLMLCSLVIKWDLGELHGPMRTLPKEEVPVSSTFQTWLFGVTVAVLIISFGFNYSMQTASAIQFAKVDLTTAGMDIYNSVSWIHERGGNTENYTHHVGVSGSFYVLDENDELIAASMGGEYYNQSIRDLIDAHGNDGKEFFTANIHGDDSLCMVNKSDGLKILAEIPYYEVYEERDAQAYETMLADILFFTVIYVLVSLLVQNMVVDNLLLVNKSLGRITDGDLNEKVDVYTSSEFASLSDDINLTVDVLKGYIDAAEKKMEQELLLAHNIQDSALPKNFTFAHKGFDVFAIMDPAREVGGDFYDFFFVDAEKMALVIADVSGKGIPAALFMMRSKTAIRGLAEGGVQPAEIFRRVNNALCEGNEINMFVTAWMGIIDLKEGTMTCCNAGHEYPVVKRSGGDYEMVRDKHYPPLGAMEDMTFSEYSMKLDPGDVIYVYTDGIPEAINIEVEQYGDDRMIAALNENKDASMRDLLPAVLADLEDFVGEAEQFDDITMLGFRFNGPQDA